MIILKHVEFKIKGASELEALLNHIKETTSKVEGLKFKEIYFPASKDEFILLLDCESEEKYLKWRKICPPPPGAKDWHEVFLNQEEYFKRVKMVS